MHRIDNSKFLLYIEPSKKDKLKEPINDELTEIMLKALIESSKGAANYSDLNKPEIFHPKSAYKRCHGTECGEFSTNQDYLLKNGMITNSLCVFYLQYYRNSIPKSEMDKVLKLVEFYKKK